MITKPEPGQPILVNIGERVLELKYPLAVLKVLSREHQINVLNGTGMADSYTDPEKFAVMLYLGLKTLQPDVTLEWVESNVDAASIPLIYPLVLYASTRRWSKTLIRQLGIGDEDDETEANPTPPATRSIGSQYGPSDDTTSDLTKSNSGT